VFLVVTVRGQWCMRTETGIWSRMTDEDIRARLQVLLQEHGDMDAAIAALLGQNIFDQLQVQRLKKRKLQLKDAITKLEDMLLPDIIA
jgi:hypothetical protein